MKIIARRAAVVTGLVFGLATANLSAIDWNAYSADNVEESAGAAVHLQVGIDPATYGFGYTYGVRLINAPYISSDFGGWFTYNADYEAFFAAPTMTFWLIPRQLRLAPIIGFGGSYQYGIGGADDNTADTGDGTLNGYDSRAASHWAVHAAGGLRLRLGEGQHIDLNVVWQRAVQDLPPDEDENEIGIRLSLGYEL
jgi:hypothetical protein